MLARLNLLLILVLVASAVSLVSAQHRSRRLHIELERETVREHELETEWKELKIEASTESAHPRVEQLARQKLGMRVPQPGQIVLVEEAGAKTP